MLAELLLPDHLCAFEAVSDLEEPLDRRLVAAGEGEVVGGGIGSGWYRFDLEVTDLERVAELLRSWAQDLELPEGTCLRRKPDGAVIVVVPDSTAS